MTVSVMRSNVYRVMLALAAAGVLLAGAQACDNRPVPGGTWPFESLAGDA